MIFCKKRRRRAVITVDAGNVSIRNANGIDIAYAMVACLRVLKDNDVVLHEAAHEAIKSIGRAIFVIEERMKAQAAGKGPEAMAPEESDELIEHVMQGLEKLEGGNGTEL